MDEFAEGWALERQFEPLMDTDERTRKVRGWNDAVRRTLTV
jgi:glycerol kinase